MTIPLTAILITFALAGLCGLLAALIEPRVGILGTAVRWGFAALALAATLTLWT